MAISEQSSFGCRAGLSLPSPKASQLGGRLAAGLFTAVTLTAIPGGCATRLQMPEGTRTIREVVRVPSRDSIINGMPEIYAALLKGGMRDEEIVDGSVVMTRTQYYRHNATSGVIREYVRPSIVSKSLRVAPGNVVELEVVKGYSVVTRVRYRDLAEGKCEYRLIDRTGVLRGLDAINPIGGPASASLYCPEVERDGWSANRIGYGVEWFNKPLPGAQSVPTLGNARENLEISPPAENQDVPGRDLVNCVVNGQRQWTDRANCD